MQEAKFDIQELCECTQSRRKSNFVAEAKNDDIKDISYNVVLLVNDLHKSSYLGSNSIWFVYGGNGDQGSKLEIAFYGEVLFISVNNTILKPEICHEDGKSIKIEREMLLVGNNCINIVFSMEYNFLGSGKVGGTGAFKYLNPQDGQHYVYTQCEPDFTQQIIPVFYNLNHKAIFRFGFLIQAKNLAVSNMNVTETVTFESSSYVKTVKEYHDDPSDERMGEIGAVNFHLPYLEVFSKFFLTGLDKVENGDGALILKKLKGILDFSSRFLDSLVQT